MIVVITARARSTQLYLLLKKPRQSAANRMTISARRTRVTAVSDTSSRVSAGGLRCRATRLTDEGSSSKSHVSAPDCLDYESVKNYEDPYPGGLFVPFGKSTFLRGWTFLFCFLGTIPRSESRQVESNQVTYTWSAVNALVLLSSLMTWNDDVITATS
jgi:BRCT domain type II-containing protein